MPMQLTTADTSAAPSEKLIAVPSDEERCMPMQPTKSEPSAARSEKPMATPSDEPTEDPTCMDGPVGAGCPVDYARFHVVPRKGWDRFIRNMGLPARNSLNWRGLGPVPGPPTPGCWMIASSDEAAGRVAERQHELRAAGWRVLCPPPEVIRNLGDKAALQEYAKRHALSEHLPVAYAEPDMAVYPCILKAAAGEYGRTVHLVTTAEEVGVLAPRGLGSLWVLQELVRGRFVGPGADVRESPRGCFIALTRAWRGRYSLAGLGGCSTACLPFVRRGVALREPSSIYILQMREG